jgi:integrase
MSITKRARKSGTRWVARVSHRGQQEVCRTFERKSDAQAWEREQINAFATNPRASEFEEKGKTLLRDFCDLWFQKHCLVRNTLSTARSSGDAIRNHIAPQLGGLRLADLDSQRIEDWQTSLLVDKRLSPKTVNNCLGYLKKILTDACRWRYLQTNPAQYAMRLKCRDSEPRFWTQDEAIRFLDRLSVDYPKFFPVFSLALYTGMRKGEIRGLAWDCVDFATGTILVKRIYCREQQGVLERTKGGGSRRIPMNRPLREMLIGLQQQTDSSGPVFSPRFPWNRTHEILRSVCNGAGIKVIKFHDLRHSFASNLVMKDRPLYEVQKLLGHADFRMTQKYAHLSPSHLRGATDCLDFEPDRQVDTDGKIVVFGEPKRASK